jgi:hypothetical protein
MTARNPNEVQRKRTATLLLLDIALLHPEYDA